MKFQLFGRLKHSAAKKPQEHTLKQLSELPVDQVRTLSSRGISQREIINRLRTQGYTYSQINEALNEAVKDVATGRQPLEPQNQTAPFQTSMEHEPSNYEYPQNISYSGPSKEELGLPKKEKKQPEEEQVLVPETTEELIEVMIAEKMIDVEDEFEKIHNKIKDLEKIVFELRDQVKELKIRKNEDEKKFLTKVTEIEDFLENSQSRIGGLEKALQQVLPTLVENVRDLTGVVQEVKKGKEE